uniref:2-oxoisovalerate dehydrogenase subunit alpha n=1 Tax=Alexandrium catenella TaxID=2925 RepID=A0A7S1WFK1_ALECA|mmetsp:Transcript_57342/g.153593  ORF Transcript_57342/g.153593 Transcript_57342/m.153593 type:complete len:424 (+) Transcript_57342:137-1408(+)
MWRALSRRGACRAASSGSRRSFASTASFAGLRGEVEFSSEPGFERCKGPIKVFRLTGEDGKLVPGAELPFSLDEAVGMYRTMLRVSVIDQILNSLQRQGRISFYMTGTGEEAAQVGTIAALDKRDVVWPQYRELGAFVHRGFTIQQVVDQCMGRKDEPGKGRQMPVHYCAAELNMQAVTSPLATQIPQAVGAGYAFRMGGEARCGVSYFGDGAASEGDFAVALNFAATLKAQTIFICRNNGWAISTPAKEQYAGDGIAVRGIAYGMPCVRVDGNDLAAVFQATRHARELCMEGEPVVIELMTYRRGHHSTSDDATRYRGGTEVKVAARDGLEPMSRTRMLLEAEGRWSEAEEEALRSETRDEVMSSLKIAEAKLYAPISDMFKDVWAVEPPQLQRQRKELFEHIERHPEEYRERLAQYERERS